MATANDGLRLMMEVSGTFTTLKWAEPYILSWAGTGDHDRLITAAVLADRLATQLRALADVIAGSQS